MRFFFHIFLNIREKHVEHLIAVREKVLLFTIWASTGVLFMGLLSDVSHRHVTINRIERERDRFLPPPKITFFASISSHSNTKVCDSKQQQKRKPQFGNNNNSITTVAFGSTFYHFSFLKGWPRSYRNMYSKPYCDIFISNFWDCCNCFLLICAMLIFSDM